MLYFVDYNDRINDCKYFIFLPCLFKMMTFQLHNFKTFELQTFDLQLTFFYLKKNVALIQRTLPLKYRFPLRFLDAAWFPFF